MNKGEEPAKKRKASCGACLIALLVILGIAGSIFYKWSDLSSASSSGAHTPALVKPANALEITFLYGSEKKHWIADVTAVFNHKGIKTSSGKTIFVKHVPMGSGESVDEVLSGRIKAHLLSPASGAFIELGNAESIASTGSPLVGDTRNLVLSPVVIAMWKPMAEALGWPAKQPGWEDILKLSKDPKGWASLGHAEWGQFKFGHTNPRYSNSGLISLLAEVYAANGKTRGLTIEDVKKPSTAEYLRSIERSVVHYGSSTGFFGRKMFARGPEYLSAAVLYENMVIESYSHSPKTVFPIVAVYPKEGTFWSDHPCGIVQREWVGEAEKEAAQKYMDYLLEQTQQQKALEYGFRPGDPAIQIGDPVNSAHGVDPQQPTTTLSVPSADVINEVLSLWERNKKHSNVVLIFDRSGSMKNDNKIISARDGAIEMIRMLGDEDSVSLLAFNEKTAWVLQDVKMKEGGREKVIQAIGGLFPSGGTALYDAVQQAHKHLIDSRDPALIQAAVVLTDGDDTNSSSSYDSVIGLIRKNSEAQPVRIFTIGYGAQAKMDKLQGISDAAGSGAFKGTTGNIREVFKNISTFF